MPSHTVAGALVVSWSTSPPDASWSWPAWREITGVRHGLFPSDDAHLPRGISRVDANDIYQYFQSYSLLSSKTAKLAFANGSKGILRHPGQPKWSSFVTKGWPTWNIHGIIIKQMREHGIHPATLLQNENDLNNPRAVWPNLADYIPIILDDLGLELFGEEAFPNGLDILPVSMRQCLSPLVQRSWNTTRVQLSNLRKQCDKIQADANNAMAKLESEKPSKASVKHAIRSVAKWRDTSELFSTPENTAAAQEALAQLQSVMEGLGVKVARHLEPKGEFKVSAGGLQSLVSAGDVQDIAALYQDYLDDITPPKSALLGFRLQDVKNRTQRR